MQLWVLTLAARSLKCISFTPPNLLTFQKFLGDFSEGLFAEDAPLKAISRFQENLKGISAAIRERNKELDIPYEYLLPERIPNSIAVWWSGRQDCSRWAFFKMAEKTGKFVIWFYNATATKEDCGKSSSGYVLSAHAQFWLMFR